MDPGQGQTLLQCPYVPSHQLLPGTRFQQHLTKCRRNILRDRTSPFHAKALEISICTFDSSHHIHDKDMKRHVENDCPAAHDAFIARIEAERNASTLLGSINPLHRDPSLGPAPVPVEAEESWEDETREEAYDPQSKVRAAQGYMLYEPKGKTQSERRRFRQNARLIAEGGQVDDDDDLWDPNHAQVHSQARIKQEAANGGGRGRGRGSGGEVSSAESSSVNSSQSNTASDEGMGMGRGRGRRTKPLRAPGMPSDDDVQQQGMMGRGRGRGRAMRRRQEDQAVQGLADNMAAVSIGRGRGSGSRGPPPGF